MTFRHWSFVIGHLLALLIAAAGCERSDPPPTAPTLVVYTSVDEPYARPILQEFERRSGIRVQIQTDTEATKSAGLAARLEAERDKPRADVWWGNEVFHTIRLAEAGALAPSETSAAKDIPAKFKDAQHRWAGCGLRARVIASSTPTPDTPGEGGGEGSASGQAKDPHPNPLPAYREREKRGLSLDDLLKPEYKGKVAMARPTAGTTGGHVAALYVLWGADRFKDFFTQLKANDVKLLGGNGPVAEAVARRDVTLGLTDNDDVASVNRDAPKVRQFLPDQDAVGTLTIPTTVALVAGAPNPGDAKKLVDYLLSPEVEQKLIDAKFAGWSVRASSTDIRSMEVDYAAAAKALPKAVETAMTILEGRE